MSTPTTDCAAERKLICAVAGSTARIQNATAATESLGEGISGQVFVPQVLIDTAWNDSFAGKLDAHATDARESCKRAFTSTRQGR